MSAADKGKRDGGCKPAKIELASDSGSARDRAAQTPDWTDGLKRLYDSVVKEPLPDSFKDLLSRLDDDGQ